MFAAKNMLLTPNRVIYDPNSTTGAGATSTGSSVSTLSWSQTASVGAAVIAFIASDGSGETIAPTYNGVAMTSLSNTFPNNNGANGVLQAFGLMGAGTGVSEIVAVTFSGGNSHVSGGSASYLGVAKFITPGAATAGTIVGGISLSATAACGQMLAQAFLATTGTAQAMTSYSQTQRYAATARASFVFGDAPGTGSSTSFTVSNGGSGTNPWCGLSIAMAPA